MSESLTMTQPARLRDWLEACHSLGVEAALAVGLYLVYEIGRGLVLSAQTSAVENARRVVAAAGAGAAGIATVVAALVHRRPAEARVVRLPERAVVRTEEEELAPEQPFVASPMCPYPPPQPRRLMRASTSNDIVAELRGTLDGRVITPDDSSYDEARTVFYPSVDRRPAVIVRPIDAQQVSNVVSLARESGTELAVRSGGHSLAGHGVSEGGIVLDLSSMRALEINVQTRTAWAQTGLTAGRYTSAAGALGLATGFGDTGSVGIGGLTLGGGVGFLVRKHGLTIDDLLAAELVTADGEVVEVDAESEPDLFWAIRGGGGNFGVATSFQFRLHEVENIVGGLLVLPGTPDVIASFVAEAEAAPEELSAIANIMTAPPLPFLPADAQGKLIVLVLICYAGDVTAGERALAPFRSLADPLADMVRPMRYAEIYGLLGGDNHAGQTYQTVRSLFADTIDRDAAAAVVNHLQASTAAMAVAQLRVLGGAVSRVPVSATAFAHRGRRAMATLAALYDNAEDGPEHREWLDAFAAALSNGAPLGAYVNFLGDEGEQRVRDAYPGTTWGRLVEVKHRYDPTNVFRLNQNVPPE